MACAPTPTQTVFSASTGSSLSTSQIITSAVDTLTSTSFILSTTCLLENVTASSCISSSVITSSNLIPITTTVPVTTFTAIPVLITQNIPIQTLFSPCPSPTSDNSPPVNTQTSTPSQDTSSGSVTHSQITVTKTSFITYSDSSGLHISTSVETATTEGGQLNSGGDSGSKSTSKLAPIIGGVVGGVLAILVIIGLLWYILWRRDQTKFLFDDDDDGGVGAGGLRPKSVVSRRERRSLMLDEETKGPDPNAYQYGVVGRTPSPSTSPLPHSQYSSLGGYSHRRSGSRDALMSTAGPSSTTGSPTRLDLPLSGGQRRISQNSSARGESIMMTNQPIMNRPNDDPLMGHHPRPSSSLLEAPMTYPPRHSGFYQQYGPLDTAQATSSTVPPIVSSSGVVHKPVLEPTLVPTTQPLPAHQSLFAAAGLADPVTSSTRSQALVSPPPGAGGAQPYTERQGSSDMYAAVMSGADRATSISPMSARSSSVAEVGFGRQRRPDKTPQVETPRSPVVQHEDAGRVPEVPQQAGADAPPPAYSQS